MSTRLVIVVDSDALIAQADSNDANHEKAFKTSSYLSERNAKLLYPVTTIAETASYMQRVQNNTPAAYGTAVYLSSPSINVVEVNQDTLQVALTYFSPKTSKKNTLFDCVVAAVAEKHNANAIFSFDKFYTKQGFKPASEL